ncbi:MAG: alpha/beta hydrolase [Thaumarchaeota archaeon]|jgi:pimeloyl-ACP methyl ester carboxylesterase|nr:alpha/beta hydrolase [Nitrososphaerota archaeon]
MSTMKTVKLFSESLELSVDDRGKGRAFLLLHGGAGPASIAGLAGAISKEERAIAPTLPGFAGSSRPDWFRRIDDVALAYLALLERMDVRDVVVVGNSIGGWIASEIALRRSPRISSVILLNAVGIDTGSEDKKIVNPADVPPEKRAALSFYDPKKSPFANLGPEGLVMMAANSKALIAYASQPYMHDPTLRARLSAVDVPVLLLWGASDKVVDVDYGRRFAESIPGSRMEVITEAGHFPQIEKPEEVLRLIRDFASSG